MVLSPRPEEVLPAPVPAPERPAVRHPLHLDTVSMDLEESSPGVGRMSARTEAAWPGGQNPATAASQLPQAPRLGTWRTAGSGRDQPAI